MRKTYFQASVEFHLTRLLSLYLTSRRVGLGLSLCACLQALRAGTTRPWRCSRCPSGRCSSSGATAATSTTPTAHRYIHSQINLNMCVVLMLTSYLCAGCPQGSYLSDLCVYETGQQMWSQPNVAGKVPQARSDTQMVRIFSFLTLLTSRLAVFL